MTYFEAQKIDAGTKLKMLSPYMTEPQIVDFRGLYAGRCIVWSGTLQFPADPGWLSKIEDKPTA